MKWSFTKFHTRWLNTIQCISFTPHTWSAHKSYKSPSQDFYESPKDLETYQFTHRPLNTMNQRREGKTQQIFSWHSCNSCMTGANIMCYNTVCISVFFQQRLLKQLRFSLSPFCFFASLFVFFFQPLWLNLVTPPRQRDKGHVFLGYTINDWDRQQVFNTRVYQHDILSLTKPHEFSICLKVLLHRDCGYI